MARAISYHAVADGLFVGEHPARAGELDDVLPRLKNEGIGAVVTVCEAPLDAEPLADCGLRALHLPVSDYDAPSPEQLDEGVAFIQKARNDGLGVLVHCFAGIGRSATVACAYLVASGMDPAAAIVEVRRKRSPMCVESAAQREALLAYGKRNGFR
ncbi:MAG: dual specificity protein phosphatase family protein [Deltaproteobacteria bacterium]|nr:dual specificity protein phosphatase family protein [Deltaproteobacteria bacterium]